MFFNSSILESASLDFLENVEECTKYYEPSLEGALQINLESEINWNNMMKAVAIEELSAFAESGEEVIITEAAGGFLSKVKEFFKKLWTKIKALFEAFLAKIASFVMNDKAFAKKYGTKLKSKDLGDLEFKGYKFTNISSEKVDKTVDSNNKMILDDTLNVVKTLTKDTNPVEFLGKVDALLKQVQDPSGIGSGGSSELKNIPMTSEAREAAMDKFRGLLVGSSSVDASDFSEELFKYFRNGEDTKDDLKVSNYISDAVEEISASKKTIDNIKKSQSNVKSIYNTIIDKINKIESELNKKDIKDLDVNTSVTGKDENGEDRQAQVNLRQVVAASAKVFNQSSIYLKEVQTAHNTFYGAMLSAAKSRNRQAKAMCVKALAYTKESASDYNDSYQSNGLLDSVKFI